MNHKTMVVAYYLSRFPTLSETFIIREIFELREMGVDVQIFSMLPPKLSSVMHENVQSLLPFTHYARIISLNIIRTQIYYIFHSPKRYFRSLWRLIWQTRPEYSALLMALMLFPKSILYARELEKLKVEHIHAHFVWVNAIAAQVASDLLDIPLSIHAHAWDIFRRKRLCVQRQIELASCIVTVSNYHRQFLSSINQNGQTLDIRIVHYGVDPIEFGPITENHNGKIVKITSVGRLVEKKGFIHLIGACSILAHKGYKIRCSIIGSGEQAQLQSQIDDHGLNKIVSLLGGQNISTIKKQYNSTDIFVLPCVIAKSGDRDGMPNVLLEAMSMQIPVITTPVTGNTELIQNGVNGILVPERDPISLAEAIEKLINNPGFRAELGQQARQTILNGFDIRSTTSQLLGIFQEYCREDIISTN
jgi:colanic acid/amylovoran biosynthesis glycosyltransferase